MSTFAVHDDAAVAIAARGARILSGGADDAFGVSLWQLKKTASRCASSWAPSTSPNLLKAFRLAPNLNLTARLGGVSSVAWTCDSDNIVTAGGRVNPPPPQLTPQKGIATFDLRATDAPATVGTAAAVMSIATTPDPNQIVAGCQIRTRNLF